jgi:hypothetical protein
VRPARNGSGPPRVTDQSDALALRRYAAGLFHCQEGLAATCSAADLDALQQLDGVEDDSLVFSQRVCGVLVGECASDEFLRCGNPLPLNAVES